MIQLDIATILVLYGTSLAAAMLAFVHVYRLSAPPGIARLIIAFGLIVAGSTLAGFGAAGKLPFSLWTLGSMMCGVAGFETVFVGIRELSSGRRNRRWALVILYPLLYGLLGLATRFHESDQLRALAYHVNGAGFIGAAAWIVWRHNRIEALPSRLLLASVLALKAGAYVVGILRLLWLGDYVPWIAYGFLLQILGNFAMTIFVYGVTADRIEQRLRLSAWIDGLTGIGNRQWFAAWVPEHLNRNDAILAIDLDHFKMVNDQHGHLIGDAVLVAAARAFREGIRDGDVLARYGGEEFVIYLPAGGREGGVEVAERLRRALAGLTIPGAPPFLRVTASLGLAVAGEDGLKRIDVYRLADLALYRAKQGGRDQLVIHEDGAEGDALVSDKTMMVR